MRTNTFQSLLRQFFLERLMNQQRVSPCTIESYRDTFRILLKYLNDAQGIKADDVALTDLNANAVIGFLNYLEQQRKNDNRTINNRLAAIKAFMSFVSYECPEYLDIVRKIKLIPFRKVEHKEVSYLSKTEIDALLGGLSNFDLHRQAKLPHGPAFVQFRYAGFRDDHPERKRCNSDKRALPYPNFRKRTEGKDSAIMGSDTKAVGRLFGGIPDQSR